MAGSAGATVGFAYQSGPWVFALEDDFEGSFIDGSISVAGGNFSTSLRWFDNFRARVGYAFDRFEPYIAFGPTVGGLKSAEPIPGLGNVTEHEVRSGWTLGAGFEYAVTPNLNAKLEYLFICLGANNQFGVDSVEFMGNFVRAGLNYRFAALDLRETNGGAMPVKAPATPGAYNWTGLYVGADVGGSASARRTDYSEGGVPITTTTSITNGGFRGIGFHGLAGVGAGYNWQFGGYFAGFETDFQFTQVVGHSINSHSVVTISGKGGNLASSVDMPNLGTFRGRFGIAAGRWLFYTGGGLAYGEVDANATVAVSGVGTVSGTTESTPIGWTTGFGFEGALWGTWSAKFEYLYIDLGHSHTTLSGGGGLAPITASSHLVDNIVRAGLNRRVDWYGGN